MKFRLTYEGRLEGNGSLKHKHEIRKAFHPQLRRLSGNGGTSQALTCLGVGGGVGFLGFFRTVHHMSKSASQRRDEVLLRMLKTPPKPHAPLKASKAKVSRVSRAKKGAKS